MATLVVYAGTADGYVDSFSSTSWADARTGAGLSNASGSSSYPVHAYDQVTFWGASQVFIGFDTYIEGGGIISEVELSLRENPSDTISNDDGAEIEVYLFDFSTGVDNGDWTPGANVGSLEKVASLPLSSINADDFTSFIETGENFRNGVDQNGETRIMLCLDLLRNAGEPAGTNGISFLSANSVGTVDDPVLTITYEPSPLTPPSIKFYHYDIITEGYTEITGGLHNVFGPVIPSQVETGDVEHALIVIVNSGEQTLYSAKVWIESQVPGGADISISTDEIETMDDIINAEYSAPYSEHQALSIGDIVGPGTSFFLIQRTVPVETTARSGDGAILHISGITP